MHIVATDLLTCPRCGPAFGLILLADRVVERRVMAGMLGCSNCRERWPVVEGLARLGSGALPHGSWDEEAAAVPPASAPGPEGNPALFWAGLMGVARGPAVVLMAGPALRLAEAIAALVEHVEVLAVGPGAAALPERPGVSRIEASAALPLASAKLAACALSGPAGDAWLEEAVRVLRPAARLVLSPAPADAEQRLAGSGCRVVAREGATLVALRE